ncbi:hypothetical protein ACFQ3T_36730, partial [Saccharothrix hoggarensis]
MPTPLTAVTPSDPAAARRTRAAAIGVAVTFGLNGVAVASWFARVPAARDALGLGAVEVGLVLLAMSAGA